MVVLVIEGGAMRAAYASGVAASLQEAGLVPEAAYGTSAGGAIAAWFAAGQAHVGLRTWERVVDRRLLSFRRAFWGDRPVIDFRLLYGDLYPNHFGMDLARLRAAPYPVWVTLSDADTAETVHVDLRKVDDPLLHLHATSALPLVSECPVVIGGRRYADGGMTCPIPLLRALQDGHREILLISNRPPGRRDPEPAFLANLVARQIPALREAAHLHHAYYNEAVALAEAIAAGRAPPPWEGVRLRLVRPAADLGVSRLSRDVGRLRAAIGQGRKDGAHAALEWVSPVPA